MVKAAETENPRYKCENVLQLELGNALYDELFMWCNARLLDMPAPTTKEWDGFNTESQLMSIDQVPDQKSPFESEIVIQAAPRLFSNRMSMDSHAATRPSRSQSGKAASSSSSSSSHQHMRSSATKVRSKDNIQAQFPASRGLVKK